MSRKIRSTFEIKSSQGYAIGHLPYGYKYDEIDRKRCAIDEEATDVVRHIFKQSESVNGIAKILKKEKIYIPSVYAKKTVLKTFSKTSTRRIFMDSCHGFAIYLSNQSYTGDVINFKTYSKSFKLKKYLENDKENWQIHKNVRKSIIQRELFELVRMFIRDFIKQQNRSLHTYSLTNPHIRFRPPSSI